MAKVLPPVTSHLLSRQWRPLMATRGFCDVDFCWDRILTSSLGPDALPRWVMSAY